jgi:hypothetical protein
LLGVGLSAPALAQDTISASDRDLQIDKIELVGQEDDDFFDDRFNAGVSEADELRLTNIEDCPRYNNETEDGDTCSVSASGRRVRITWSLSGNPYDRWSVKAGNCSTGSLDESDTSCVIVADATDFSTAGDNEFEVELARLIGTLDIIDSEDTGAERQCCADQLSSDSVANLYVYLADDDTTDTDVEIVKLPFDWDYKAPAAPSNVAVSSQGQTVSVSWDKVANEDEDSVEYRVYYADFAFSSPDDAGVSSTDVDGAKSSTELSFDEQGTFYFAVATVDESDNASGLSDVLSAVTVPTSDGFEYYKQLGGSEDGGFCFVATAAYGSYLDPHVVVLRRFRDQVLLDLPGGRSFVAFYYREGAAWASVIAGNEPLRAAVRLALLPAIALAWFLVELSPLEQVLMLAGLWMLRRILAVVVRRLYWTPATTLTL